MDRIDVKDGPCCVTGEVNDERRLIPVGLLGCLLLEWGTRLGHEAVKPAVAAGTLLK